MIKKVITSLAVGGFAIGGLAPIVSAFEAPTQSGYAVVSEDTGIIIQDIQSEFLNLSRTQIENGTLRGTWSHGNQNTNWLGGGGQVFSSVTGSSQNTNARAQGRGTVRNGNGHENTGGWRAPGTNSRGEIDRTSGTNRAFWDLRRP